MKELGEVLSIQVVREPIKVITPSWYTYDASQVLEISDAVAVCTSICKHEMPYQIFVGRRQEGWQREHPTMKGNYVYTLDDIRRDLTPNEKNVIYDNM